MFYSPNDMPQAWKIRSSKAPRWPTKPYRDQIVPVTRNRPPYARFQPSAQTSFPDVLVCFSCKTCWAILWQGFLQSWDTGKDSDALFLIKWEEKTKLFPLRKQCPVRHPPGDARKARFLSSLQEILEKSGGKVYDFGKLVVRIGQGKTRAVSHADFFAIWVNAILTDERV